MGVDLNVIKKAAQIKLRKRQIANFILASLLLVLNFTVRYGVSKEMRHYNADKTRYEKLALAYHLGGQTGIDYELKMMTKHDPKAADFVPQFSARIKEEKDVQLFIRQTMADDRDNISRLKKNRFVLSCIIYLILTGQALLTILSWWKDNRHHFQKVPNK